MPSLTEQVVDAESAIDELADGDPRPLLILLETQKVDEDVKGLLDAALNSERFKLASKWFHCLQVDESVLERDHPYHSLFAGKHPARLVLASRTGKKVVGFLGTSERKVSWSKIASVLKTDYRKNPTSTVKAIERLLCKFDANDDRRKELNKQLEKAAKKNQRSKVAGYKKRLALAEKEREALLKEKSKLEDLGLRQAKVAEGEKATG